MKPDSLPGLAARQYRALLWKEWRESWWLLILTAVGPAGWHVVSRGIEDPWRALNPLTPALFFFFGLTLGAGLFATERDRRTSNFLAERPAPRGLIWTAKAILPCIFLAGGYAIYGVALFRAPMAWLTANSLAPIIKWQMWVIASCLGLSSFAAGALVSAVVDRAVTAWAGGGALLMVLGLAVGKFLDTFVPPPSLTAFWRNALPLFSISIVSLLLLWLSRILYTRNGAK